MTPERASQIYQEVDRYRITLVPNPPSAGYLNSLISTCRNYLNAVARIIQELSQDKHRISTLLNGEETAYKVEFDDILQGDVVIRNLPNIKDREAAINVRLRDRLARISILKSEIQSIDFVDKAVRLVHRELKGTMSEIRLQRSLIRDEIDTKSFYGDERETMTVNKFPIKSEESDDGLSGDEIERLFQEHEAEQTASQPEDPKPVLTLVSDAPPEPEDEPEEDLIADAMTDAEYDQILSRL
jgi:hypothetical protein